MGSYVPVMSESMNEMIHEVNHIASLDFISEVQYKACKFTGFSRVLQISRLGLPRYKYQENAICCFNNTTYFFLVLQACSRLLVGEDERKNGPDRGKGEGEKLSPPTKSLEQDKVLLSNDYVPKTRMFLNAFLDFRERSFIFFIFSYRSNTSDTN